MISFNLGKILKWKRNKGHQNIAASQVAQQVNNPPADAGVAGDATSILSQKILWRRAWQPTTAFSPGESHGQRSLEAAVYGAAESDTSEMAHTCLLSMSECSLSGRVPFKDVAWSAVIFLLSCAL